MALLRPESEAQELANWVQAATCFQILSKDTAKGSCWLAGSEDCLRQERYLIIYIPSDLHSDHDEDSQGV